MRKTAQNTFFTGLYVVIDIIYITLSAQYKRGVGSRKIKIGKIQDLTPREPSTV